MHSQKSSMHSSIPDKRGLFWDFKWNGGNKSFGEKKNEKLFFIGITLMGLLYLYLQQLANQATEITWKEFITK